MLKEKLQSQEYFDSILDYLFDDAKAILPQVISADFTPLPANQTPATDPYLLKLVEVE